MEIQSPKNHGVEKITLSGIYLQKGRTKGCGEREGEGAPPADVPVLQNKQRLKMRNDTQTLPLPLHSQRSNAEFLGRIPPPHQASPANQIKEGGKEPATHNGAASKAGKLILICNDCRCCCCFDNNKESPLLMSATCLINRLSS